MNLDSSNIVCKFIFLPFFAYSTTNFLPSKCVLAKVLIAVLASSLETYSINVNPCDVQSNFFGCRRDLSCPNEPNNSLNSFLGASNSTFRTSSFVFFSPSSSARTISFLFFVVTISERTRKLKSST